MANESNGGTWGGARPGAGRKPTRPEVKRNPFTKPPATPARSFLPSPDAIAAIIEASKATARQTARTPENNPFRIYEHPQYAMPKDKTRHMAMDDALNSQMNWAGDAWLSGQIFSGIAAEGLMFLGYPFLSELAQRPEYRTVVECIADDATRKWIDFEVTGGEQAAKAREAGEEPDPDDLEKDRKANGKSDKVKEIKDELIRLEARERFYCACRDDGFFGRTHMFLDVGNVDLEGDPKELAVSIGDGQNEMSRGKVTRGTPFKRIQNVEPVWTYPQAYNATNPLISTWYTPQQWYVMGKEVHRSRLRTIIARPVPDMLKPAYSFGGLSLSQIVKPYVDIWLTTRQSVGELIHAFSVMVLETDLQTILQPGVATSLLQRIALFNAMRDNQGAFVINKATEGFSNVSAPISGLAELQAQSQEHVCSVARLPLVKYTGISPQGLNASSEGEIMVYDDTISAYQNRVIRADLTTVVNFIQLSRFGEVDPEITMEFQKLREMTEEQEAELQKKKAEAHEVYVNLGAIDAGEVRKIIIDDPELPYADLDPDDVPEPPDQGGGEGGFGEGGGGEGGGGPDAMFGKEPGGANDAVIPFADDAAPWSEGDHPRGQPGNAGQFGSGGGGGSKQKLKMPQFGLTPTPRGSHQQKAKTGGEFFEENWHKAASVGGHSQPTPAQVEAYTSAWENQGKGESPTPKGPAPLQPKDLKRVGKQMGSNPGGVFENAQGERFYVKQGQSKEHVANELAAADLYRLAGARTLEYQPVEGGEHIASRMAKLDKNRATQFSPAEVKKARRDFVTHAWLANWDAVGTGSDNLGTIEGEPTALDLGGALAFRAQGAPKGAAFGDKVTELETMRDPKTSPDAAKVFGGMSPDELKESAQRVTSIPDEDVRRVIAGRGLPLKVAEILVKRKHDVASRFGMATDEWQESDHPRGEGGKFATSASGSGGGGEELDDHQKKLLASIEGIGKKKEETDKLYAELAGGKAKKTKFGGLWKETGGSEMADYEKNAAIVLGKPANAGQSYRQMLAFLIKENEKHFGGGGTEMLALKAKLVEAWQKAVVKLKAEGKDAEAQKIESQLKAAGAEAVPLAAAASTSNKSAQDLADVKKYSPKFYAEAEKIAGAHAFPGDKESAQKKVIAAVAAGDATVAALEVVLSSTEENALTSIYGNLANAYSSVKQTLEKVVKGVAAKTAPTPAPPKFPAPTQAELEKAKKSVPLKLQYLGIPNAPETKVTNALLKTFNDKYEGKTLTGSQLAEKVNDFKALQGAVAKVAGAAQENALKQQAEQQAAQQTKNKTAAEELKKSQAASKAKNAEYVKALGISETEATGFDALIQMMGKESGGDVVKQFQQWETEAKKKGLKNVTGFQYALIRNYIDGGYKSINNALRAGTWTAAQHVYARLLNKALDTFPKYTGTVVRGATLDASQIAHYKAGHVVPEQSFTSTGKGYKFDGNVHYTIKATGKRGADFHASDVNAGEQEVLFKANTFFMVHKVEVKDGVTHIEMEEVDDHG